MIIEKLKEADLRGRGGAGFPTGLKWEMVRDAKAEKKHIICNASEGEPNVFKDGFILENHPEEVVVGVKIALETMAAAEIEAYIYLRKDYYRKFKESLEKLIGDLPITLFKEPGGYLCGEETTLIESIEGNREEPRDKPPYPPQYGLFGCPTLVNNVETFYYASKIAKDSYKHTRFYSLSGDIQYSGVYELPVNWTVKQVLEETNNLPRFMFFVQAGGGASGPILTKEELDQEVSGSGAIVLHNLRKTNLLALMRKWAKFFFEENCGKCVPCREGVCRLNELLRQDKFDERALRDLLFVLGEISFCPLGKSVAVPFEGLLDKVWKRR